MQPQDFRTRLLAEEISAEGVVACPAEAVWGLSCDPYSDSAVSELLLLKGRPVDKGLIVVAAEVWMLAPLLDGLPDSQRSALSLSWPGPNTWLVPNKGVFPLWVTGNSSEVAVRITSAPALRRLSYAVGGPVVSTSANPAGVSPARHGFEVVKYFGAQLPRAVGSVDLQAKPSTIRRAATGEVVRS